MFSCVRAIVLHTLTYLPLEYFGGMNGFLGVADYVRKRFPV